MNLRYPRVRLFVFDRLLSNDGDCAQAVMDTAKEFGLETPGDVIQIRGQISSGGCDSLLTARVLLQKNAPAMAEKLFQQLVKHVDTYKQEQSKPHCRGAHDNDGSIGCNSMAAVVMDYLLQVMEPYHLSPQIAQWQNRSASAEDAGNQSWDG